MSYHRHVFSDPRDLLDEEKSSNISYDRREIVSELKPFAKILIYHGVFQITPFTQLFKDYGFSSNQIGKIIKYLTSNHSRNILPVDRVFDKSNSSEKNLMFTSLALILNGNLTQLLSDYLSTYFPNFRRNDDLIKNYAKLNEDIVDRASKYANTTNISILINNSHSEQFNKTDYQVNSYSKSFSRPCKLPGIESFDFIVY